VVNCSPSRPRWSRPWRERIALGSTAAGR
jgi:hypothetical protein